MLYDALDLLCSRFRGHIKSVGVIHQQQDHNVQAKVQPKGYCIRQLCTCDCASFQHSTALYLVC